MLKRIGIFGGLASLVFLIEGCETPNEVKPLTDSQLHGIFSNAKDARHFWVTVYKGDQGVQFAGANRLHPEHVANLPFVKEIRAPMIRADNGREETITALIDTSAAQSWLDLATFVRIRAIPLGPPAYDCSPNSVRDNIPGYACILTKLRLDQLHIENALFHFRAATGPLDGLAREEDHPAPSAILGCDLLKNFAFVRIDYPSQSVMFSTTLRYSPDGTNLIATLPLKEVEGAFASEGMVDNKKQLILLDTAGDFEIAMDHPPSETVKQVSVGTLVFRNVTVVSSGDRNLGLLSYPRIGRRLLSRYRITFAPKQKLVYFERPAQVSKRRKSG